MKEFKYSGPDYDFSDDEDNDIVDYSKKTNVKIGQKPSSEFKYSGPDYDFSDPDNYYDEQLTEVQPESLDKGYEYLKVKEKSPEELKKMSISEKMEYIDDLKREREYLTGKGVGKGILSGLTFGATENIDALKPRENEIGGTAGNILGAIAPVAGISKAVGLGIKGVSALPNIVKAAAKPFLTGSIYESGKQAVNAASGKPTDLMQIPITGTEFAAFEGLLAGGKKLAEKFYKLPGAALENILEKGFIPEDLPKRQRPLAEELLKFVEKEKAAFPDFPQVKPSEVKTSSRINPERITSGNDAGVRPIPSNPNIPLKERIVRQISPTKINNTTQSGQELIHQITDRDQEMYTQVRNLYNTSRDLNRGIVSTQETLFNELTNGIAEVQLIPHPSRTTQEYIRATRNILNNLAEVNQGGVVTNYNPISNQTLIDQVQELNRIVDYDFSHGEARNIFRRLIRNIEDAIQRTAQTTNPSAAEALSEARNARREWGEIFDNDYVNPFRDRSNWDFSKNFKKSLQTDSAVPIRRALGDTPQAQNLIRQSNREIVEKNLSKFFKNPKKANLQDFDTALRELEPVMSQDEISNIREQFVEARRDTRILAKKLPGKKPTNDEIMISKYKKMKPEDIQKMMNTTSGRTELRNDFKDDKIKSQVVERLFKQKLRSITNKSELSVESKPGNLAKILNNEENYEVFADVLGEVETENLLKASKALEEAKINPFSEKAKAILNKYTAYKTLQLLISII